MASELLNKLLLFCIIYLSIIEVALSTNVTDSIEAEAEEYDEKLSEFIIEILENLRDQMPEGLQDIGVPPLDPLAIPTIEHHVDDQMARVDLRMHDLSVTGLSRFELRILKADLQRGFVNVSLALPELNATGLCLLSGRVIGIFPVSADGPFYISVKKVNIDGYGDLDYDGTGGKTRIHMSALRLTLTFETLDIKFESLLGGQRWTQVLVKILTALGPRLFAHFHEKIMEKVDQALLKIINKELDKGTLSELLDHLPF